MLLCPADTNVFTGPYSVASPAKALPFDLWRYLQCSSPVLRTVYREFRAVPVDTFERAHPGLPCSLSSWRRINRTSSCTRELIATISAPTAKPCDLPSRSTQSFQKDGRFPPPPPGHQRQRNPAKPRRGRLVHRPA